MIFGRPGSGKSTFAAFLSRATALPLHHLDKYFFIANWEERNYDAFLQIQKTIVDRECWIVDGNSTRSLELRWAKADCVLYFNFPKWLCAYRILKRVLNPHLSLDDKAPGCQERLRFRLLKYMWGFEDRVAEPIQTLKISYPKAIFREIRSHHDLKLFIHEALKKDL